MLNKENWYNNLKNKKSELLYERLINLYSHSNDSRVLNEAITLKSIVSNIANWATLTKSYLDRVITMREELAKIIKSGEFKELARRDQQIVKNLHDWLHAADNDKLILWAKKYEAALASEDENLLANLRNNPEQAIAKPTTTPPKTGGTETPPPKTGGAETSPPKNNGLEDAPSPAVIATNKQAVLEWINGNQSQIKNISETAKDEADYINKISTIMIHDGIKFPEKINKKEATELLNAILSASGDAGKKYVNSARKIIGNELSDSVTKDFATFVKKHYGKLATGIVGIIIWSFDLTDRILAPDTYYRLHQCKYEKKLGWFDRWMCSQIREKNSDKPWAVVEEPAAPTAPQQQPQPQTITKEEPIKIGDRVKHPKYESMGCYKVTAISGNNMTILAPKTKTTKEVPISVYVKCQ